MKKIRSLSAFLAVACCLAFAGTAHAEGRAKLSLQPEGPSTYITNNSDPWLQDSWETISNDFKLDVTSLTSTNPIYLAQLVLSIPYNTSTSGWNFTLNGHHFDYSSFTHTGNHPYLDPHGVFSNTNGALWTEYSLGTLNPGQTDSLEFVGSGLPHGLTVHFDAYGSSSSSSQNGWYKNAYSHDVTKTTTPEPVSAMLFLTGGAALGIKRLRRKKA